MERSFPQKERLVELLFFFFPSTEHLPNQSRWCVEFALPFLKKKQLSLLKEIKSFLITLKDKFNWAIFPFRNFNKLNGQLNIFYIELKSHNIVWGFVSKSLGLWCWLLDLTKMTHRLYHLNPCIEPSFSKRILDI